LRCFKCQKWGKKRKNHHISIVGFQCVAVIHIEGRLLKLCFICGL
jgi:hypothetical protein